MTHAEVITLLDKLSPLRRKRFDGKALTASDVPVHFMGKRTVVILPDALYSPDEQIVLEGKFQLLMSRRGEHAFLDFSQDWRGIDTHLKGGFN